LKLIFNEGPVEIWLMDGEYYIYGVTKDVRIAHSEGRPSLLLQRHDWRCMMFEYLTGARAGLLALAAVGGAGIASATPGTRFDVPSDSRASYTMLSVTRGGNGHVFAISRRDGPSGTSYSRREIDCAKMLFRYTGEGDSMAQAQRPYPRSDPMRPLVHGSISDVASRFACRRAGR
jgi:hypothetical protein